MERPRDRRRREREHVDLEPERAEELLLRDAEPLLLVEDDEPELLRDDVAREDAVRADEHVDLAGGEVGEHLLRLRRLAEPRDHLDVEREVAEALAERVPVLLGEDRRRAEHEHLPAVDGDGERRADGDLGLAEADVAADEPVHRPRRLEILLDRLDRPRLVVGLAVRERRLEPLEPLVREVEARALGALALRVEREQLARELAHGFAGARLEVLPRLAAELRERGRLRVGADVAGELAELLVRDVEPVVAAEGEEEVVARDAGDLLRLEAEELADAVILVDDVVADPQVGERGERPAEPRVGARRPLAEDLRVGQQHEAEVAPDEAAPRRRDREPHAGVARQRRAVGEDRALDLAQQAALPLRLAAMRERDDDAVAGAHEAERARSRPRRGPRAAIAGRCASNWNACPRGNGSSSVAPSSATGVRPSSSQTARTSSGCQTKSGARSIGGDEIAGIDDARLRPSSSQLCARSGSMLSLRRSAAGIDPRVGDRVQRPLREGRERAHLLDLVPEQLDPQRLPPGRREDVDDAAADGELAALVDAVDALVARARRAPRRARRGPAPRRP